MADPNLTDKAPLDVYLAAIHQEVAAFVQRTEAAYPIWRARNMDIVVRCALRPSAPAADGSVVVWADMDISRSQQVTEITIPFKRMPDPEPDPVPSVEPQAP